MTIIYAITSDQVLSATILPKLACNNQNTVRLHVKFDDAWNGYAKSAVFHTDKDPTPYEVIFSAAGDCLIPPEVLTQKAKLCITVKGVKNGEEKSSTELWVKVLAGTPTMIISDPTGTIYNQVIAAYGATNKKVSEEAARLGKAVEVERARIDNISKLAEGSTTGDAELADIRIGADGATDATAGAAVRRQVGSLLNDINLHEKVIREAMIYNLFDGNYEYGSILIYGDTTNCDYAASENSVSCIVNVKPNTTYHIKKYDTSDRHRVATHSVKPIDGTTGMTLRTSAYYNGEEYTITTGENDFFMVIQVSSQNERPRLCITENYTQDSFIEYGAGILRADEKIERLRDDVIGVITQLHGLLFGNVFDGVYESNTAILSDGAISTSSSDNCKSAIIRIAPNTHYYVKKHDASNRFRVATCEEYPKNGISATVYETSWDKVDFVSGENDKYLIVYVSDQGETPRLCVTIDGDSKAFIDYGEYITKDEAAHDTFNRYYFLDDLNGLFDCPTSVSGGSVTDDVMLTQSDCNVIYDMFDELVSKYPNYVTKTTLGEVSGYPYNKYTFDFLPLINESDSECKKMKFVIVAGIHGYEQGTSWCAANFFKLLCESSDERLGFMKRNIVFEVVPVANPYGFSHNQRKNENGVDLNRNFDSDWVAGNNPEDDYYGGAAANSEAETQLLIQFLNENLDADYVIDYHNIAGGYPMFYLHDDEQTRLCNSVFSALTNKWTGEYSGFPTDRLLGYCKTGQNSTLGAYARKLKMRAFTLETPWIMPVIGAIQYDKQTVVTGIEVFANTIIAIIKAHK